MLKRSARACAAACGLWALWLLLAAAVIGAVAYAIGQMASRHLEAEAQRASQAWAQHMVRAVQDIDLVFAGEVPPVAAQDHLATLRGTANLYRFRLYDPEGRLLLLSESLGRPLTDPARAPNPAAAEAAALAPLGRVPTVRLHRSARDSDRPALASESYIPVRHGSRLLGVVAVELDLTSQEAVTTASFRRAAMVAAVAMSLVLIAGALLYRERVRRLRQSEERAQFLSQHDLLTGVLNRETFRHALAAACHDAGAPGEAGVSRRPFALLMVDLRHFRDFNETHGVAAGDQLLRDVATQLRALVRRGDLLARLSADQFALLLHGVGAHADAGAQAERIVTAIARPREPRGPVQLAACAGAALFGPDGRSPDALMRAAGVALTRAKANGDGRWSCYDAALDQALQERRELAQELRIALAQEHLRLHFQPIFERAGSLIGYEALVRWPHAQRGPVPPSLFIGIAEESGLIDELGRWVLRTACREAATWPKPLHVAVNLSPAQVRQGPALLREVREALAAAGLPGQRLEVEITESLLMGHDDEVLATLHGLVATGVRIALDDFGTGFSSLAYLWRYPFGKVKIDRAFTQRLGHEAKVDLIVRSIVRLAHALGMRVNAEGVETEQQRAALLGHGCDELQGFLLGRPMPVENLPHRAAGWAPASETAEAAGPGVAVGEEAVA